jgi:hypothetical protein
MYTFTVLASCIVVGTLPTTPFNRRSNRVSVGSTPSSRKVCVPKFSGALAEVRTRVA